MSNISQNSDKTTGWVPASTGISDFADQCVQAVVVREQRTRSSVLRLIIDSWASRQESAKKAKL